jgi:hypothetical protein
MPEIPGGKRNKRNIDSTIRNGVALSQANVADVALWGPYTGDMA